NQSRFGVGQPASSLSAERTVLSVDMVFALRDALAGCCPPPRLPVLRCRAYLDRTTETSRRDPRGDLDRGIKVVGLEDKVSADGASNVDEGPLCVRLLEFWTLTVVASLGSPSGSPGVTPGVLFTASYSA